MKTIACVLNTGGMVVRGRQVNYSPHHVRWLKAMCERFAGPHRFVCLSNVDIPGVEVKRLKHEWNGWWSKIELFDAFRTGCFYMDLDTVIVGDFSHILASPHRFTANNGFAGFLDRMNSSVMAWDGDYSHIYTTFRRAPSWHMQNNKTHRWWGDQGFINRLVQDDWDSWQKLFPGQVVSWKLNLQKGDPEPDNRIVCFHGAPKPHEIERDWIPRLCA